MLQAHALVHVEFLRPRVFLLGNFGCYNVEMLRHSSCNQGAPLAKCNYVDRSLARFHQAKGWGHGLISASDRTEWPILSGAVYSLGWPR